jgi:protein-disulfide isomerase
MADQRLRPDEVVLPRRIPYALIGVGLLLLVILGGALYYVLMPLDAPIPEGAKTHYADLEQGTTEQGFARLGRADAPILIEDFSSYACPHCRHFHEDRFDALLDEIASGDVQFVFIPVAQIGPGAENATRAAFCAGEQGQYWAMTDVLFNWQGRYTLRAFDEKRLQHGAENLGLDAVAFEKCMNSEHTRQLVSEASRELEQRGLTSTPTFFINGQKVQDYAEFDNLGELADTLRGGSS